MSSRFVVLIALALSGCSECNLPSPGTYVLDEEHFVSVLSAGDPAAAEEIRRAFFVDNKPSTWKFIDDSNAEFTLGSHTQALKFRANYKCEVVLDASETSGTDEVLPYRSTSSGFCFTFVSHTTLPREECFELQEDA